MIFYLYFFILNFSLNILICFIMYIKEVKNRKNNNNRKCKFSILLN